MPLALTPNGAVVTYSRGKCALFGVIAAAFAVLMIAAGIDVYLDIFDGTPLDWIEIDRRPDWAWGAVMIAGGVLFLAVASWNGRNALPPGGAAIEIDETGVTARTLIGRRALAWEEIDRVSIFKGTMFLHPVDTARAKPVPLQTYLTSVGVDELYGFLAAHRPGLMAADEG